eukprot:57089-Eustigmatos_ZCMA.PRE.1
MPYGVCRLRFVLLVELHCVYVSAHWPGHKHRLRHQRSLTPAVMSDVTFRSWDWRQPNYFRHAD